MYGLRPEKLLDQSFHMPFQFMIFIYSSSYLNYVVTGITLAMGPKKVKYVHFYGFTNHIYCHRIYITCISDLINSVI